MIIKSFEIKKSLNKNVNIYLFYGPNNGLIEDLINENLKPIFSKNLFNYEETEILSDIENFKEFLAHDSPNNLKHTVDTRILHKSRWTKFAVYS